MAYYAEIKGIRVKIKWSMYEALLRLNGWQHVIQQEGLAIISKTGR